MRVQRELEDATREVVVVPPEPGRVAACIEAALPTKSIASYVSRDPYTVWAQRPAVSFQTIFLVTDHFPNEDNVTVSITSRSRSLLLPSKPCSQSPNAPIKLGLLDVGHRAYGGLRDALRGATRPWLERCAPVAPCTGRLPLSVGMVCLSDVRLFQEYCHSPILHLIALLNGRNGLGGRFINQ